MRRLTFACFAAACALALPGMALAQSAPPPVAAAADVPLGRLPDAAAPKAYRIDLTIDPSQERFSGRTEIDAVLKTPASRLWIHGRDLAVSRAEAVVGGRRIPATYAQVEETGVALLTFAESLPAGQVTLSFAHDAAFGSNTSGLYRVKVGDAWHVWSQLQSIDARAVFPSFDEPGFKTPITVTLRTPPGLFALSNAPQVGKDSEGGLDVHRFAPTLPLPTYLAAFVVGPFERLEGAVPPTPQRTEPLPLRIVTTRNNAGKMAFPLKGSQEIVALLESYFGDAFPYPKLDQISSPIMPGAMENAGADIYGDTILMMDETAPVAQKRVFGMVVAHELAHQWFGDLVTPAWWDDIWLNESFANWMGYRIGHEWRPDLNIGAGALAEGFAAMNTDALLAGRPIRQPITTNAQIDASFDSITYGKGGHVVAMIAAFMGDERFRNGVRRYMAAHRNGNATSDDFFAAMAAEAGNPGILPAMRSFIDQQGVPLLTFTGGKGRYTVRQDRFALYGGQAPAARWGVPLCLRRGETRTCQLIEGETAAIEVPGKGPLVPNAGGTGYFRFELPAREWDALIATADRLPGGEAQAVADSLFASFRAGRANVGRLARLARKLVRNPDSYASGAALRPMGWLAENGFVAESARPTLRRFAARLVAPKLAELGFDPRAGAHAADDPDRAQARVQAVNLMAGTARDAQVRQRLLDAARAWLGGDEKALDPVWFDLALSAHVEDGGMMAAQALASRAVASEDEVFRDAALGAVAGSGKKDIARWLLEDFRDDRLRPAERRGLLAGVLGSAGTRDFGYGWLVANYDRVRAGSGIFLAARLPQMLGGFCSVERAADMARDFRPRIGSGPGALELERTIERVHACGVLKQARGSEVTAAVARLK